MTDGSKTRKEHFRFPIFNDVEIQTLPDPQWLVEGLATTNTFMEIHGQPGSMKSFFALSLSMSIAAGQHWHGRAVKQGPVVYIAAEGVIGYKARVNSWKTANNFEGLTGVHFVTVPVPLLDKEKIESLVSQLESESIHPVLIVFDTLSRCFEGGQENSVDDMSRVVAAAYRLRDAFGATIMLVHHTRKDGGCERGSSALRGAVETMYALRATGDDEVVIECEKMKDGKKAKSFRMKLVEVETSCVLVTTATDVKEDEKLSPRGLDLLTVLMSDSLRHGEWKAKSGIPAASFNREIETLTKRQLVVKESSGYALSEVGKAVLTESGIRVSGTSVRDDLIQDEDELRGMFEEMRCDVELASSLGIQFED
jgi:hypothetical protein